MKRRRARPTWKVGLGLVALTAACTGSPAPPAKAPEVAIVEDRAAQPVEQATSAASAFDLVDENAELVALLDASALRQGELFRTLALLTAAVPGFAQSLAELESDCGFDPITELTRVAFSGNLGGGGKTSVVAFEVEQPQDAVFACAQKLAGDLELEPKEVMNYPAVSDGDGAVVAKDGVFVAGGLRAVERALKRGARSGMRLPPEVYLYVAGELPNPMGVERAELELGEGAGRLRAQLSADTTSSAHAGRLVESAERARELLDGRLDEFDLEQDQKAFFRKLLEHVHVEQRGAKASATLDIDGHDAVSALVGMGAALAVYGVKRYVARAKTAEGRARVAQISERLREYADGTGKGRLPASAPLTPKTIPTGAKLATPAGDWQHPSWKAIGFSVESAHYFAYEFVTAKDKKSAVVKARADLDDDGNVTVIESTVTVEKDGSVRVTPPAPVGDGAPLRLLGP